MADAVVARWHGDNYQARVFWENALNLLLPHFREVSVAVVDIFQLSHTIEI